MTAIIFINNIDSGVITCEESTIENLAQNIFNEHHESKEDEEEVKKEEILTVSGALLSCFVHINIGKENIRGAMSSLYNTVRNDYYYNLNKK